MPQHPTPGGRHELGQNFLIHLPTVERIVALVRETRGPILEIGAGDGALTRPLADLDRKLRAIDIDPRQVSRLRARLPGVRVDHADVLEVPLDAPVIVGNIPFHLTTPILRRLLSADGWRTAVLLTQWEVARKRAGVGGGTLLTAQTAPWFAFHLDQRVPAAAFRPRPNVDGGLLVIARRDRPFIPPSDRVRYASFVRRVFGARGRTLEQMYSAATGSTRRDAGRVLGRAHVPGRLLPRDLGPEEWAALWRETNRDRAAPRRRPR